MTDSKPGRGSDQFPLRLPDGMRDRIKSVAADNGRSMNAEIVSTLEDKYPTPDAISDSLTNRLFKMLAGLPDERRSGFIEDMTAMWKESNSADSAVEFSKALIRARQAIEEMERGMGSRLTEEELFKLLKRPSTPTERGVYEAIGRERPEATKPKSRSIGPLDDN